MRYRLGHPTAGQVLFEDEIEGQSLSLPEAELAGFVTPADVRPISLADALREALAHPVGSAPLRERVKDAPSVAIITSDSTRSVPTRLLLDLVVPELQAGGVPLDRIVVVVGTGVHRDATPEEMQEFLGPRWAGRVRIENHRPYDESHLVRIGRSAQGTELLLNRTVAEAGFRIAFGQVEPHEFAGFSGGPKSILPAVSGEPTIRQNHAPDRLLRSNARPGVLEGNPIWEEMLEAARLAHLDFIVNVVMTPAGEVAAVTAGEVRAAHRKAVEAYKELYGTYSPAIQADIVVTTPGPPLNLNLYQSVKAVVAGEAAVRDGGVVVLYSGCREGTGGDLFVAPYRGLGTPEEVIARLRDSYRIEMDHALLLCRLQRDRGLRLVVCAPGVDTETLHTMLFTPAGSLQEAYHSARARAREGRREGPLRTLILVQPQKLVMERNAAGTI